MPERKCNGTCNNNHTTLSQVMSCMALKEGMDPVTFRKPYWGKARSKNLIGAGFVVGFRNDKGAWRLDWDTNTAATSKFFHVNYEGADGTTKIYHLLNRVDAQPHKWINLPDGFNSTKLTPLEQMKRLWFSWTKHFIDEAKTDQEVIGKMNVAYRDIGIDSADAFISKIRSAARYSDIESLLQNTKS